MNRWCEEAGGNITINFLSRGEQEKLTTVDSSNPFWVAFKSAVDELYEYHYQSIYTFYVHKLKFFLYFQRC